MGKGLAGTGLRQGRRPRSIAEIARPRDAATPIGAAAAPLHFTLLHYRGAAALQRSERGRRSGVAGCGAWLPYTLDRTVFYSSTPRPQGVQIQKEGVIHSGESCTLSVQDLQ